MISVDVLNNSFSASYEVRQESWIGSLLSRINALFWQMIDQLFSFCSSVDPKEMKQRNVLAHFHAIANLTSKSGYEGGSPVEMARQWEGILRALPDDVRCSLGEGKTKILVDAFDKVKRFPLTQGLVSDIQNKNLVILPIGSKEHCVYAVFYRGYLAICNRGQGDAFNPAGKCVAAYKIDTSCVTQKHLDRLIRLSQSGENVESFEYIYRTFIREIRGVSDATCTQLSALSSDFQKVDNCSLSSAKEGLMAAYAMLGIQEFDGERSGSFLQHIQKSQSVKTLLSAHARAFLLDQYLKDHSTDSDACDRYLVDQCLIKALVCLENVGIDVKRYPSLYERYLSMTESEKSTLRTALLVHKRPFISPLLINSQSVVSQSITEKVRSSFSFMFLIGFFDIQACFKQIKGCFDSFLSSIYNITKSLLFSF